MIEFKKILKCIYTNFVYLLFKLLGKIDKDGIYTFNAACKGFERTSNNFCNYLLRSKYPACLVQSSPLYANDYSDFAIIVQGPIEHEYNFTIETIKLYKQLFPLAKIIVSTWSLTPCSYISEIKKYTKYVILNKEIQEPGFGNVNFQICTTFAGVKKALEIGCKYCLKTRGDMRIYRKYSLDYLSNLLKTNPVLGDELPIEGRIISLEGGFKQPYLPNWIQDFMYFGYTKDLYKIFDIPYDLEKRHIQSTKDIKSIYDLVYSVPPERYITLQFLKKYINIDDTIKAYWQLLKKYFYYIDFNDLNVLWNKYDERLLSYNKIVDSSNYDDKNIPMNNFNYINIINDSYRYDVNLEKIYEYNEG